MLAFKYFGIEIKVGRWRKLLGIYGSKNNNCYYSLLSVSDFFESPLQEICR